VTFVRAKRTLVRTTGAGRALLPAAGAGLLASWMTGGVSGLLTVALFGVLVVSVPLAWFSVRGLRASLPRRREVTLGDLFTAELRIWNASRFFRATDVVVATGANTGEDPRPVGAIGVVPPRRQERFPIELRLLERGRHRSLTLTIVSRAPLNLCRVHLVFELPVDLWALPRRGIWSAKDSRARGALERSRGTEVRRAEEEFYGVREWRPGESLRLLHWKLSARRDDYVLRDQRDHAEPPVHLWLCTKVSYRGPWAMRDPGFERACSLVATLGEHFLRRGREVRLSTVLCERRGKRPIAFRGRRGLRPLLLALAEIRCEPGRPWDEVARFDGGARGAWNFLCLAGGGEGRTVRNEGTWILDVEDPDLGELFQRSARTREGTSPEQAREEGLLV